MLAVDPSVSCTGYAFFYNGMLTRCATWEADSLPAAIVRYDYASDRVVVELPRVYPTARQKGDPNDLVAVAAVAGAWASRADKAEFVYPHVWKGQLPKRVCEDRIRALLSAQELAVLERDLAPIRRGLRNNAIDAVGIGLWASGRRIV